MRRRLEKGHLFAAEIEAELMSAFECKMCGRTGAVEYAQEPSILHQDEDELEVAYGIRCICRETGFFKIRMSKLMFGQLLTMSVLGYRPNYGFRRPAPIASAPFDLLLDACIAVNRLTAPDKTPLGREGNTTAFRFSTIQRCDKERLGVASEHPEE